MQMITVLKMRKYLIYCFFIQGTSLSVSKRYIKLTIDQKSKIKFNNRLAEMEERKSNFYTVCDKNCQLIKTVDIFVMVKEICSGTFLLVIIF